MLLYLKFSNLSAGLMDILKHILRGLYSGEGLHLGIYINVEHLLNKTKRPP